MFEPVLCTLGHMLEFMRALLFQAPPVGLHSPAGATSRWEAVRTPWAPSFRWVLGLAGAGAPAPPMQQPGGLETGAGVADGAWAALLLRGSGCALCWPRAVQGRGDSIAGSSPWVPLGVRAQQEQKTCWEAVNVGYLLN